MLATYEDLNPNRKFVENLAIERIDSCEAIAAYCKKKGLKWTENKDLIKNIYNDLQEQPFYKKYMESSARSFREDAEFAANIFLNILEQNGYDTVKDFPPIRVFGTVGFICAMLFVNFMTNSDGVQYQHS